MVKGRGRRSKQLPEPMKVLPKGRENPEKLLPMALELALMSKVSLFFSLFYFPFFNPIYRGRNCVYAQSLEVKGFRSTILILFSLNLLFSKAYTVREAG